MTPARTLIAEVIRAAAAEVPGEPQPRITAADAEALCALGLGPLAEHGVSRGCLQAEASAAELLQGAALTSRLVYKRTHHAVREVIARLNDAGATPTLLKGISVAEQFYEPPWTRVMGDVDLLIPGANAAVAEDALRDLGYLPDESEPLEGPHHHLPALRNPDNGVIIELHTALFSTDSGPAGFSPFDEPAWRDYLVQDRFDDQNAHRFTGEFQLAYTLMHWAAERKWADSVFGVLDFLLIARNGVNIDWCVFFRWMENSKSFATAAMIMFTYLERARLLPMPAEVRDPVAKALNDFGEINLGFAVFLVNRFPMSTEKSACRIIDRRAALASWRSLLMPGEKFASLPHALWKIVSTRFSRITLNTLRLARRLKSNFG